MIIFHKCGGPGHLYDHGEPVPPPADYCWIDLVKPDAIDIAFIKEKTGFSIPSYEKLVEIESSSRIYEENGALYLSAPLVFRTASGTPRPTPLGFILTKDLLITIRFEELRAFDGLIEKVQASACQPLRGPGIFVWLLEGMADRMADTLERVASDLDDVSQQIFGDETSALTKKPQPRAENERLRAILRRVGRAGDVASLMRDSLLGQMRIVPFVMASGADWLTPDHKKRLKIVRQDLVSLNDYESHLTNKVQFLLDATLGLTNIDQNNIFRILTVVSVVGVPPTLVASMYGMNFKHMPELDWAWGYPWGLTLIALTAIVPLVWFKVKGWL